MDEFVVDIGIPDVALHVRLAERDAADTLLVFMPSAVAPQTEHQHPAFARWQWAQHFPASHVAAYADPAMGMQPALRGAWFMHPNGDIIKGVASATEALAGRAGAKKIILYGSSLGGFGALALASLLPNAVAIAEVPQIDFGNWWARAKADVEQMVLGRPLEEHRARHPYQVSVRARMEAAGRIPPYVIVSNVRDNGYREQLEFHEWVCGQDALSSEGRHELRLHDDVLGHGPLGIATARALIQEQMP